ncbi:hypothetical protein IWW50_001449 [Coemansia erecta]|nr:hypothetical protein IWW50_001449 [Coemansia erecta]
MSIGTAGEFIELLVRSPSVATPDDFKIRVLAEHTISQVKAAIEREHQAMPLARHMRIIWKGRILKDQDKVKSICESDEQPAAVQTVHFVMNVPVGIPYAGKTQAHDLGAEGASTSAAASQGQDVKGEGGVLGGRGPAVVPLGNQFQYVLVAGVPYLKETRPQISSHSSYAAQQRLPAMPETQADRDAVARARELQIRLIVQALRMRAPDDAYTNALEKYDQLRSPATPEAQAVHDAVFREREQTMRQIGRALRARAPDAAYVNALDHYDQLQDAALTERASMRNAPRANVRDEPRANVRDAPRAEADVRRRDANHENAAQLADMIRGFGFNTVWSFVWMLLRMLLLVVVLAHDASMGRMLLLVVAIASIVVLRSAWAQQQLQGLNFGFGGPHAPEPEAERREYTVLEKARALVIALVTSLVPAEPFQIPAPDA